MKLERSSSVGSPPGGKSWWPFSFKTQSFGSTVAIQKLRESKWFKQDEERLFCSVIESGFIVEVQDENSSNGWFGVVDFSIKKDKKPTTDDIFIFTVKRREQKTMKVVKLSLSNVWNQGYRIRINNFQDRDSTPHSEKDIKSQIVFTLKTQNMNWHNTQHFAHWCRYGTRTQEIRKKQLSECLKYGTMSAGIFLIMNQQHQQRQQIRQKAYTK